MKITDAFLLPKDVLLLQVASLHEEQRHTLQASAGDYVITRARGRTHSKVVDAEMARLLGQFKEGKTIVDAVLSYCKESALDPEVTLEAAFPVLEKLIRGNFLATEGSKEADKVEASLANGDEWEGFKIIRPIQILEDSEIYQAEGQARKLVALKLARPAAAKGLAQALSREAKILEHLDGKGSARLLAHGTHQERPYLAMEWCEGVNGARAAARFRSIYGESGRRRLLDLCCAIADAYANLHARNVIHGDVHSGNLIISERNEVTIIDFGFARLTSSREQILSRSRRGGFGYYYEPEYAESILKDKRPPQASDRSDQHILAHLLYRLISGHDYANFSAERQESMRQLVESKPMPFSDRGIDPWPDVEKILGRAMSPEPGDRFESIRELSEHLRHAAVPEAPRLDMKAPAPTSGSISDRLLSDYLQRLDPAGFLFESGLPDVPHSSITFGSGGIAYFLYRIASIKEDAELLSWAKLWIEKAISEIESKEELAFTDKAGNITRDIIGKISLYHTETGLFATKALIGFSMGDIPSQMDGLAKFVSAAARDCDNLDVTLGSSGILLGCALLNEAIPRMEHLLSLGNGVLSQVWEKIKAMPSLDEEREIRMSGIAHGWSGILYAILMWCRSTGAKLPEGLADRLVQLADLAESTKSGLQWRRTIRPHGHRDPSDYDQSWCNGSGGIIHLWTLAHLIFKDERYLELAKGAALDVIANSAHQVNQICCGGPGQTYGMLNLYKHTGDEVWLAHARQMTEASLRSSEPVSGQKTPEFYYCLYKGPIGLALLSADLEKPEDSCMPLFESQRWVG